MIHRYIKPFPIYDSILLDIIIADNNEEISAALEPEDRDPAYYACVSRTYYKGKKAVTVILNTNYDETSKITPAIVVHEAVHVKNKVYMTLGIKNDRNNDEPEAYFVEWIFNKVMRQLRQFNRIKNEQQNNTTSSNESTSREVLYETSRNHQSISAREFNSEGN